MRLIAKVLATFMFTSPGVVCAQEAATRDTPAPDPEVETCQLSGLLALKEPSPQVKDISLDLDSMRLIRLNSKIENVDVKAIVLADVNIERKKGDVERKKGDRAQTFVCLIGDKGKVLLTVFSNQ